jgi:arylsulfatase A-like enzyme
MPSMIFVLLAWGWMILVSGVFHGTANAQDIQLPNILWITCEDTGPQLGCYGDSYATTPNIDSLAQRSLMFTRCWSNAPVCAPARTTLIAGLYPTSYGAQHMRSSVPLPAGASPLPAILRQAGYYCSNNSKEDYNFPKPQGMWDDSSSKAHWRNRKPGQPFFAVFNSTLTHEGQIRKRPYRPTHDPKLAPIPPYHPEDPEVRLDWAQYYDRISEMDAFVGDQLQDLEKAGLTDSTIVFFFGDHGCGLPRGKRWLYQSGLHVPMIVHIPKAFSERFKPMYREGATSGRLVAFVDLLPTVLDLCQLPSPEGLHGRSFFAPEIEANRYLYGFRDRMDERVDSSRALRDDRYLYIRNFMPDRPQGSYLNYMFQTPTTQAWKRKFDAGELNDVQKVFWEPKAVEELYDIQSDPYQVRNIASDPEHQAIRQELADALKSKMHQLQDTGAIPEDWIRNERKQDMELAIDAAWRSGQAHRDVEVLVSMLQSAQVIERYWGAVALRAGGVAMSDERVWNLSLGLLNDPSLDVRAVVAESVVRHSQQAEQKSQALNVLLEIPLQKEAPWGARMIALNALCDLEISDQQAARIQDAFERDGKSWSRSLPDRYSEYLTRLVSRLVQADDAQ